MTCALLLLPPILVLAILTSTVPAARWSHSLATCLCAKSILCYFYFTICKFLDCDMFFQNSLFPGHQSQDFHCQEMDSSISSNQQCSGQGGSNSNKECLAASRLAQGSLGYLIDNVTKTITTKTNITTIIISIVRILEPSPI